MALRKTTDDLTQVILEAAHHHVIQIALDHLDATTKPLRVQELR
jgi:hypothetical protein